MRHMSGPRRAAWPLGLGLLSKHSPKAMVLNAVLWGQNKEVIHTETLGVDVLMRISTKWSNGKKKSPRRWDTASPAYTDQLERSTAGFRIELIKARTGVTLRQLACLTYQYANAVTIICQ